MIVRGQDFKYVSINKGTVWLTLVNSMQITTSKNKSAARKNLMRDKEVIKQMETNQDGNSFVTIKDHK